MWQRTVSCDVLDKVVIENIASRLKGSVCEGGGEMSLEEYDERENLSIAAKEGVASVINERLSNIVADQIATHFKRKYIQNTIKLPKLSTFLHRGYIQALVSFDTEYEKELIVCNLPDCESLAIDGVVQFMIPHVKDRWSEVSSLAISMGNFAMTDCVAVELIKFLLSTMEPKFELAYIESVNNAQFDGESANNSQFDGSTSDCLVALRSKGGERDDLFLRCTADDLLKVLIENLPRRVVIDSSFAGADISDSVRNIFDS